MSSVRGGTSRGRGHGSTQQPAARGRGASSTRGSGFNTQSTRGNTATRSSFGQASRGNATRPPRASGAPRANGSSSHSTTAAGAFNRVKTSGSPGERFQALTKARERERADAIQRGLIADPEKPRSLADAITPVGTCQEMCPEYERVQRIVQNDVWNEETDQNHSPYATTEKPPDESRMVKKFRRSAAGLEEQLPSDLRPPPILKRTCDYLLDEMIGKAKALGDVHHFVWDRTRAIRNDFSIQQVQKREELMIALECYERIARFHIVSLHQLALPEKPYSKYDWQQEREQLDRTLLSLMQLYDDSRERIPLPNEAEFRAYCVILQLQDPTPDLEDRIQSWPRQILQDRRVQKAIELYMAACNIMDAQGPLKPRADHLIARQDWQNFWTLVASKEISYLMACAAEVYFNLVRRMVLNAIFRTSWQPNTKKRSEYKSAEWTVNTLCELLAFDEAEQVYTYCEHFGFGFKEREDGEEYLDLASVGGSTLPEPSAGIPKQSKSHLVEDKRFGRTLPAIINGLTIKQAEDAGLVTEQEGEGIDMGDAMDSQEQPERTVSGSSDPFDDGESLFIPESKPSTLFQSKPLSPLANGVSETATGSKSGIGSGFTFGKPSNFGGTSGPDQSAKTQETQSANTPAFNFLQTSKPATTTDSPFSFAGLSKATDTGKIASPTFTPSAPTFAEPSRPAEGLFSKPVAPPATSSPFFAPSSAAAAPPTTNRGEDTMSPKANFSSIFPTSTPANSGPVKTGALSSSATNSQFGFSQPPATPAAPVPRQSSNSPEMKSSQPHFTSTPHQQPTSTLNPPVSTAGQGLGTRKLSSSRDHRPEKPSPLSHSFTVGDDSSAVDDSHPPENTTKRPFSEGPFPTQQSRPRTGTSSLATAQSAASADPPGESFDAAVDRVADEFYTDPIRGILKQYIDYHIRQTIREVQDEIETQQLNEEADRYNHFRLHTKYGRRWRDLFWQKRLAKSGRERRERRRRRLEQRSSLEADGGSLFDASFSRIQSQTPSIAGAEEFGVRPTTEIDPIVQPLSSLRMARTTRATEQPQVGMKRPMSSHGTEDLTRSKHHSHKRMKSTSHIDQRGRVTKHATSSQPANDILKRSSFLGFSPSNIGGIIKNTTKTSYFRLKALGVRHADDLPVARGTKRPLSALGESHLQTSPPALRPSSQLGRTSALSDRAIMPPPSTTPSRPATAAANDDELLARLKAAREKLSDSTAFLKSTVEEDQDFRRSLRSSASFNEYELPSMAKARADARLRASHGSPDGRASNARSDVPAYRLRESRFVPREDYGKAIQRSREFRESRSRDTSRPETPPIQGDLQTEKKKASAPTSSFRLPNTTFGSSSLAVPSFNRPNGVAQKDSERRGFSAFAPAPTSEPSAAQPPDSLANHTTKMSSENPFLKQSTGNAFPGFIPQETPAPRGFGSQEASSFQGFVPQENISFASTQSNDAPLKNFTIQPSQINEALSNSWGSSHGFGTNKPLAVPQDMDTPPQQDSYLQSQAISLISDDEDEDEAPQSTQRLHGEDMVDAEATEEFIEDDTEEDEPAEMNGHINPYAALAYQDMDEDQESYDSEPEDEEGYDQEEYDDRVQNGFVYTGDEGGDEEGINGDIDDDEIEDVEYDEDEDADGYDYTDEEGEETQQAQLFQQQYDSRWATQPQPKGSAFQDVGDTAEEAIELSD